MSANYCWGWNRGNFETSALLSKEALMEPLGKRNENPEIADLEVELLTAINKTGIGPQEWRYNYSA